MKITFQKFIFFASVCCFVFGFGFQGFCADCPPNYEKITGTCVPSGSGLPDVGDQDPFGDVLINFMDWIFSIFAILAIIAFAISGIQYLTAVGDESAMERAKRNVRWSIIGVAVGLLGYVVIQTIDTLLRG